MGETIGREIRRLRERKGWGQAKLAVEAGMSVSGVSQIENGKRNLSTATLDKLAKALDVEVADLFPKAEAPLPHEEGEAPPERRKRERRATALMHKLADRGEALEEGIKASPDSFPLGEVGEFGEHHLAYRMLYEELVSKQAPSPELREAFDRLHATSTRVSELAGLSLFPEDESQFREFTRFARRRAETPRDREASEPGTDREASAADAG